MYRNQYDRLELRLNNCKSSIQHFLVVSDSYVFEKEKKGKGTQKIFVWKCKTSTCPVKIRTDVEGNNEIFCDGKKHNHEGTLG